jgi:hypothetical protein
VENSFASAFCYLVPHHFGPIEIGARDLKLPSHGDISKADLDLTHLGQVTGAEFDHLRSEKMRKLLWALVVLSLSFFFTSVAHAQDTVEVFSGYSYLRPPVSVIETILPPAYL